jgi:xylulokinase
MKENQDKKKGPFYAIGIDMGTSGTKVALVDDSGTIVSSARGNVETILTKEGGGEQDANEWWRQIMQLIKDIVGKAGIPPEKIVAIGTSSTWSNIVAVDKNCNPLMNAIMWMDTRGAPYVAKIVKGFPSVKGYGLSKVLKWMKIHGIAPVKSGIDCVAHINYIKHERPDIYAKTYRFVEPMDFVISRMTGRIMANQCTMFATIAVDNNKWGTVEYNDTLLKLSGIDKAKLPDLLPNDSVAGTLQPSVAAELGLLPTTKVMTGINDNISTALGSGVVNDFDGAIIVGTTLVMTSFVPFKKTDLAHLILTIPSAVKDRYIIMGVQGAGGRNLEFLVNNLLFAEDCLKTGPISQDIYAKIDRIAAESPAGSNGVMYLPWVTGTIVPDENPHARAVFFNLGMNTLRSHMCRAVMEGVAFNNLWTKGPMEKFTGHEFKSFRLSGGGALSNTFAQILADVLNVPIHQVVDPLITSARGCALCAFMLLGYRSKDELPDLVKINQTFHPDVKNRAIYDKLFAQFMKLQKHTKPVFNALNG